MGDTTGSVIISGLVGSIGFVGSTGSGTGDWGTESYRIRRSVDYNDATNGIEEEIVFGNQILGFNTNGTERMRIDSSGNVLVTSPAGLGYGTGAGGTVTQATSKSTSVTLNKPTGQITMNNAALLPTAFVTFQILNSLVTQNDTVITSAAYTGSTPNPYNYRTEMTHVQSGAFNIRVTNISAGSLSDALVINFAIIKGATA